MSSDEWQSAGRRGKPKIRDCVISTSSSSSRSPTVEDDGMLSHRELEAIAEATRDQVLCCNFHFHVFCFFTTVPLRIVSYMLTS